MHRPAMHQAPAVQWHVPRLQIHALVLLVLWLAGVVVHAFWWLTVGLAEPVLHGLGLATVLASATVSFAAWTQTVPGSLYWNGTTWAWGADGRNPMAGTLTPAVDFQSLMVLRFDAPGHGTRWLWVGRAGNGVQWRAFRRAAYSRQDADAAGALASGN